MKCVKRPLQPDITARSWLLPILRGIPRSRVKGGGGGGGGGGWGGGGGGGGGAAASAFSIGGPFNSRLTEAICA